jgi:uncharacterized membrane protein
MSRTTTAQNQTAATPLRKGGSPLHAPIAHIVVGAYATAVVCDLLSVAKTGSSATQHDLFRAGTFSMMVATGTLFVAVIAGLIDRSRYTTAGSVQRRKTNIHMTLMLCVGVVAIVDIVVRRHTSDDAVRTPVGVLILTLAVGTLLFFGGMLGGRLVYRLGVATAAGAPETGR